MDKSQLSSELQNLTDSYQNKMKEISSTLEKDYLRKMQIDLFRCSIKCCENESLSTQDLESCINNCGSNVMHANNYINEEIQNMQDRLQRCMTDCGDRVRDELPENASQKQVKQFITKMEPCAKKCLTTSMDSNIPAMMKRIRDHMKKYN